jgi:predicted dehydrogenase
MKVAVLGLGSAGARHARNLLDLGHEVIGFDPVSAMPEGVTGADSAEEAVAASEAVLVTSPNSLHADQAVAALERGRHVLVEKPLAVTVGDAERVVRAASQAGVVCGIAMNLRFHPAILELKRLIDSDSLGAIRFVRASFGYDLRLWHPGSDYRHSYSARSDLGGGVVLDAIHELDYLLWLLGPVASVSADAAHISDLDIDVEDIAVALLRFESGALGTIDLNFVEPVYRRTCLLVGSASVASWDFARGTVTVRRAGEDDVVTGVDHDVAKTYRDEVADFLDAIERRREPRTPVREGAEAVRLANTVKAAASSRKAITVSELP